MFAAFLKTAGLDMVSVSYRETAPAVQDLSEGRIHVFVQAMTVGLALRQAGKADMLAVANSRRAPIAPEISDRRRGRVSGAAHGWLRRPLWLA